MQTMWTLHVDFQCSVEWAIDSESSSQGQLRQQALTDLQRAWKSVRRMETLSDDPAEAKVAERAVAFVDKAFAELEGRGQ